MGVASKGIVLLAMGMIIFVIAVVKSNKNKFRQLQIGIVAMIAIMAYSILSSIAIFFHYPLSTVDVFVGIALGAMALFLLWMVFFVSRIKNEVKAS